MLYKTLHELVSAELAKPLFQFSACPSILILFYLFTHRLLSYLGAFAHAAPLSRMLSFLMASSFSSFALHLKWHCPREHALTISSKLGSFPITFSTSVPYLMFFITLMTIYTYFVFLLTFVSLNEYTFLKGKGSMLVLFTAVLQVLVHSPVQNLLQKYFWMNEWFGTYFYHTLPKTWSFVT